MYQHQVQHKMYALLDSGPTATLCNEHLLKELNISCDPTTLSTSAVNKTSHETNEDEVSLTVSSIDKKTVQGQCNSLQVLIKGSLMRIICQRINHIL